MTFAATRERAAVLTRWLALKQSAQRQVWMSWRYEDAPRAAHERTLAEMLRACRETTIKVWPDSEERR